MCILIETDSPGDQGISIILNGEESELKFFTDGKGNKVHKKLASSIQIHLRK